MVVKVVTDKQRLVSRGFQGTDSLMNTSASWGKNKLYQCLGHTGSPRRVSGFNSIPSNHWFWFTHNWLYITAVMEMVSMVIAISKYGRHFLLVCKVISQLLSHRVLMHWSHPPLNSSHTLWAKETPLSNSSHRKTNSKTKIVVMASGWRNTANQQSLKSMQQAVHTFSKNLNEGRSILTAIWGRIQPSLIS